jgi:hypothetical protein
MGSENSLIQASITPSEIYQEEGRPAPIYDSESDV